jgi:hypothetical protein
VLSGVLLLIAVAILYGIAVVSKAGGVASCRQR